MASTRSARAFLSTRSSDSNGSDSSDPKLAKKKTKLRDAPNDSGVMDDCEAAYLHRMERLARMGLSHSNIQDTRATAGLRSNSADRSFAASTRRRSADLYEQDTAAHQERDRDRDRAARIVAKLESAVKSGDADAVTKLLECLSSSEHALVNSRGNDGKPPLMVAAGLGRLQVVRALLTGRHRSKVNLDAQSSRDGRTALHAAVEHGHYDVVKFLLLQGARANKQDDDQRTAAAYAQRAGDSAMVALVKVGDIRRKLFDAAQRGEESRVSELLGAGHHLTNDGAQSRRASATRELDRRNSFVTSSAMRFATNLWQDAMDNSLLLAAKGGQLNCVGLLVERGADIDSAAPSSGRSALHLAVMGDHLEVVQYLLEQGADTTVVDNEGRSVKDEARKASNRSMIRLLSGSEGNQSSSRGDDMRRPLNRRGSSVSWAPEVMTREGDVDTCDYSSPVPGSIASTNPSSTLTPTDHSSSTASSTTSSSSPRAKKVPSNLWDDPLILTSRIPLDKLEIGDAMSRGAFGDVYRGWYRGEAVAIKRLHPSINRDMTHIDAFLTEIKLMASMNHPQIVRFVGVAWDSLSEMSAVSELMAGGDLGTMLQDLRAEGAPRGFRQHPVKLKLAAEVAHALTYLHSMAPAILHRDLKSRNILLTADRRSAKLTDFGTSRETAEMTLTAGIGTSLWMAPEVIMGERYGPKADIFSLGVVFSELATHELPYAHEMERESGRPLSIAAVLHKVTSGTLDLDFAELDDENVLTNGDTLSASAAREVVSLARSCVKLDAAARPTAAHVAYVLRKLLPPRSLSDEP